MQIEIKLDDLKRCEGCLLFVSERGGGFSVYTYPGRTCSSGFF